MRARKVRRRVAGNDSRRFVVRSGRFFHRPLETRGPRAHHTRARGSRPPRQRRLFDRRTRRRPAARMRGRGQIHSSPTLRRTAHDQRRWGHLFSRRAHSGFSANPPRIRRRSLGFQRRLQTRERPDVRGICPGVVRCVRDGRHVRATGFSMASTARSLRAHRRLVAKKSGRRTHQRFARGGNGQSTTPARGAGCGDGTVARA